MAGYRIEIKKSAAKELQKIAQKDRKRIIEKIRNLSSDPTPVGSKKLSGGNKYRVRQGDYRILYEIFESTVTIVVVRIAHRRDVYRKN